MNRLTDFFDFGNLTEKWIERKYSKFDFSFSTQVWWKFFLEKIRLLKCWRKVEQGFSSFLPALQLRCMYSSKTLNPTFENPWITKDYNSAKRKGYHRKKFYAYMFSIISSPKYFFKVFFINLMNFCTHTQVQRFINNVSYLSSVF